MKNELIETTTHEQFKEKLAKKLANIDVPCHDYHFIDEVANFCNEKEINDQCNPTECWLRVFEQIEKEGICSRGTITQTE